MPPPPPLPPPPPQHTRINLGDLKSQISRRLGPEKSQLYFSYLNRLLSQRLSKPEFNKLCLLTLGRENISLHNQLIRAILKNACSAKVPPPLALDKGGKPIGIVEKKSPQRDDGFNQPPIWSNGDILPLSPKRGRSGVRDRRIKDRPSPLGPNGITEVAAHHTLPPTDEIVKENGALGSYDLKRPVQYQEDGPAEQPAKRPRRTEKPGVFEVVEVDVEDADQKNDLELARRGPLQAPLGIPFCPPSVGGARKPLPLSTSAAIGNYSSSSDSGELFHTDDLRKRMEKIAEEQGLEGGVTMDCANLLNNGLDAYLKRLIRSCVELAGARSGNGQIKQPVLKQQGHGKPINGIWVGNHMNVHSGGPPLDVTHDVKTPCSISLQDFRVAMELNPQQLGEDWPLLLEKICLHSAEE